MDITSGSSPEQGGVAYTDALGLGVPYLVKDDNCVTTTASHILNLIEKSEWSIKSSSEFICAIERILSNSGSSANFFTRTKLRKDIIFEM